MFLTGMVLEAYNAKNNKENVDRFLRRSESDQNGN